MDTDNTSKVAKAARCAAAVVLAAGGAAVGASGDAQAADTQVQVWLTPDLAGATAFADAAATPGGVGFHRYLSPKAYTERFGASVARAKAVADWLTQSGLGQVRVSSGRDYVSASGAVSKLTVPASLAADVLGVTGLGGGSAATTAPVSSPGCSKFWAEHVQSFQLAYQGLGKGSLPVCGYSADQIRAAYGASSANTGKGVTVALTEGAAPAAMFTTLTEYAKNNHLPAPRREQFRQVQAGADCGAGADADGAHVVHTAHTAHAAQGVAVDDEAQMDSEALYAMAPDADQLMVVGGGCDEDQALLNAALSVLIGDGDRPGASIVSNSWQIPLGFEPASIIHAIDLRAAAEGVGMYFVSGDTPGLTMTGSDPYATVVGGTTLGIGARNDRVFETGWSTDYASLADNTWTSQGISGGGGGVSLEYGQPAYQRGVVPTPMAQVRVGGRTVANRAVPDLAAAADPDTGFLVGYIQTGDDTHPGPYQSQPNAGTSLACPLIAGLIADAEQGQASPYGFINPLLYRLAGTASLHDMLPLNTSAPQQNRAAYLPPADGSGPGLDVFGAQDPHQTQQVLAKGYDTMTGLGTPNGDAFISGLRQASR
ncbi:S53 family peptidase [Catenulispora yoronensis]|uniref:S53 family peptidase n=1 Tax=Catenulispora yoronensis TaxID=450799 RepID=A0ABP5F1T1_9ACTN